MKRSVREVVTRRVGTGGDGEPYGVTRLSVEGGTSFTHRDKPCATCPWRKDSRVGRFPAQAYRESANVAYDMAQATFACHESGVETPATCAGFLLVNADHNMSVRFALSAGRLDPDKVGNPEGVPLYKSYREMAIANGVPADDPVIAPCRSNGYNDEEG